MIGNDREHQRVKGKAYVAGHDGHVSNIARVTLTAGNTLADNAI